MTAWFYVHTTGPIDVFDGMTPLSRWIAADPDADRAMWAMRALFALEDSGRWEGDLREGPYIGVLPDPENVSTAPYLVAKQDNNGTTFVICDKPLGFLDADPAVVEARRL